MTRASVVERAPDLGLIRRVTKGDQRQHPGQDRQDGQAEPGGKQAEKRIHDVADLGANRIKERKNRRKNRVQDGVDR